MFSAPGSVVFLLWLAVLVKWTREQGFLPSFIHMSGPTASSFFVSNTSNIPNFTLVVVDNTVGVSSPNCSHVNNPGDWVLASSSVPAKNSFVVTVTWSPPLCGTNETNCCTICVVQTVLVIACQSSTIIGSLTVQAEIYSNSTFTGTVTENATVIPNQAYQPLGACPCNLTAGACDVGCCCDQECTTNLTQLFNGSCYSGVFGGNITPAFDQLCSVQSQNNAPDWFPFLCVYSSMDNSPFLGYFFQGSTISPSQVYSFAVPLQTNVQVSTGGYKQGDPIVTDTDVYLSIPQFMSGYCIRKAPVAFLQNFDVTCISPLTYENIGAVSPLKIKDGKGASVALNVTEERIANYSKFIALASTGDVVPVNSCVNVTLGATYTFIWEMNKLNKVNVNVNVTTMCLNQSMILTQRFVANFVNVNSSQTSTMLSGNPGYQVGKPVLIRNASDAVLGTLNLWSTVGRGFCSSTVSTPVLFGEDSTRGCIYNVNFDGNCSQLRDRILEYHLQNFVQVKYVATRGNSNASDLSEWLEIIYAEPSATGMGFGNLKGVCLSIPANLNIQIITANIGAVEGIPQQAILGAKVNFSTVTFNCGESCTNYSLPITATVQFINVPAVKQSPLTRFQLNYTEYDCDRNEVCWPQLAYPLTRYYTGEPYSQSLAKGMFLVFFFILAAVLGGPWDKIREAWNNTTF
ncbi:tectonic-2 [Ambystoma mexicanum]|uniref:tectonic-2 n=1 Tax=Ambystoma mexicanum TaxID=8296 RepID=UPI0037E90E34